MTHYSPEILDAIARHREETWAQSSHAYREERLKRLENTMDEVMREHVAEMLTLKEVKIEAQIDAITSDGLAPNVLTILAEVENPPEDQKPVRRKKKAE